LVPSISWTLIGWVWVYNLAWMFVLGGVRLITELVSPHAIILDTSVPRYATADACRHCYTELKSRSTCFTSGRISTTELFNNTRIRPTLAKNKFRDGVVLAPTEGGDPRRIAVAPRACHATGNERDGSFPGG
jgi:hypothetical protein